MKIYKAVAVSVLALIVSVATAGGNKHGDPNGSKSNHSKSDRGQSNATVSYEIDANTCEATITSTHKIKKVVLKDGEGNVLKKWRGSRSKTFDDFGMYSSYLADGQVYIQSGRRTIEVGDDFRADMEACLMPDCPFENKLLEQVPFGSEVIDGPDYCLLRTTLNETAIGGYNGASLAQVTTFTGTFWRLFVQEVEGCISVASGGGDGSGAVNVCSDFSGEGTLSFDEASACAVVMGCSPFAE